MKKCEYLGEPCNAEGETSDLYCYVCLLNEAFRDLVAIKNSLGNAVLPIGDAFRVAADAKDFFKVVEAANKFYNEKFREKGEPDLTPFLGHILDKKKDLVNYRV